METINGEKLTFAIARAACRAMGYSINKKDGEYRVAPYVGSPAQREARAYYTDALDDAVATVAYETSIRNS